MRSHRHIPREHQKRVRFKFFFFFFRRVGSRAVVWTDRSVGRLVEDRRGTISQHALARKATLVTQLFTTQSIQIKKSATPNVLGGKAESLLSQTISLVYEAIYEIKWFFYMIMNKLYYVVGSILVTLYLVAMMRLSCFLCISIVTTNHSLSR